MRKKELLLQIEKILKINQELFFDNKILTERLKENEAVINNLNGQISSLNDEIDNLKSQLEEIKNTTISNANSCINDDVTPAEDDFLDLYDDSLSREEKREIIAGFYKKARTSCHYCSWKNSSNSSENRHSAAEQY